MYTKYKYSPERLRYLFTGLQAQVKDLDTLMEYPRSVDLETAILHYAGLR